jgi:hypothetical protein
MRAKGGAEEDIGPWTIREGLLVFDMASHVWRDRPSNVWRVKEGSMDFIADFGFNVKQGKGREFQQWMSENESKFAAACPDGVEYIGTYAVIYSSEKHAGAYRQFFRFDSYGAQDAMAAAMKEDEAFVALMDQWGEFIDLERGTDWSSGLYKAVTDLSMWSHA